MLDLSHIEAVSKAIRGICYGRVYLKVDAAVDDTILQIGVDDTENPGLCIPGAQLFNGASSLSVKIVEPRLNGVAGPDGVRHSETITAVEPTTNPLHLTLSAPLTKAYTVAAGAYVELASKPSVCSDLKTIVDDFMEAEAAPEDKFFPGIFVVFEGERLDSNAITEYNENLNFLVRYVMPEVMGQDNKAVCAAKASQLVNLLMEDNYLGGTVHESNVVDVVPSWSTKGKMLNRGAAYTQQQRRLIFVDIYLEASRVVVWDKISG